MMMKRRFLEVVLSTLACVFLIANAGEARMIHGKTVSSSPKLSVSAVDEDGGAFTVPVKVTKKMRTPKGMLFSGEFDMNLPNGKKFMFVFKKVMAGGGTVKAMSVAKFAGDAHGGSFKTQLMVTPHPRVKREPSTSGR